MKDDEVNGWPLPPLLVSLLRQGRWRHPGDIVLKRLIPFLREPVDFLPTVESMRDQRFAETLADDPEIARVFRLCRGSRRAGSGLPWLDVEKAIFLAVNRYPGDDLGIALDYRAGTADPLVVASDWDEEGCSWRAVATFSEFAAWLISEGHSGEPGGRVG